MTNSRKCEPDCYSETDGSGTFQDDVHPKSHTDTHNVVML